MTDAERRAMNRMLLALGDRICKCCLRRLALTEFTPHPKDGRLYYAANCKLCVALAASARYREDAQFRAARKAAVTRYNRRVKDTRKRNRRREYFTAVIGAIHGRR